MTDQPDYPEQRIAAVRDICYEVIAYYRSPEYPGSYSQYAEGQADLADRILTLLNPEED